ncbi:MAG: DJ-1/PfpI family protein [Deltaproteobacteria bacterium]|nr:DJ-1/PfpI family protein [Deltaproteobacteria bacterium]
MTKRVLVPIATGFEEIEALTVVDILRRAEAEVVLAGLTEEWPIVGRSNVSVIPDMTLDKAFATGPFDTIVLPGGLPNAYILRDDERVIGALKEQAARGGNVAAICASPVGLDRAGLLEGKRLTSHPSIREELSADGYCEERVVVADRVITSRAAGTAMEFAFAIVMELFGLEKVEEVNAGVLAAL